MAERIWTKPQWDAITARGGSLLVSAAAGSGKTAVLVERAIRLLCDLENPVPADRLLVVTFSRAAAAEMKQRMSAQLSVMIAVDPANVHLQRQQALLQSAQISTIHSFCLELIRDNFQHLDISPDFSLADSGEIEIMQQDCARDCVEEFYQRDADGSFASLVELLSSGRDDSRLVETVLRIYAFSRSHPFYEHWLDKKRQMYDPSLPVADTVWGRSVLRHAISSLRYCRETLQGALQLIEGDEALEKGYLGCFQAYQSQVADCLFAAEAWDWDMLVRRLASFDYVALGRVKGEDNGKLMAKAARDRVKKTITDLAKRYMNASGEEFRQDIEDLAPKVSLLFDLVKAFGHALWRAKGEKKRLDFSDLEHLALRLLVERDEDGGYHATERAREIAEHYEMVMVDEYQDTNEVQDMIFSSVSRMQRNLFMVGDVKQSIYRFRQAMPEIFLSKKRVFFPYGSGFPARINLDTNFRSRSAVTDSVNYLFGLLMSEDIGEMAYTEEESLKCGAVYPEFNEAAPELILLERAEDDNTDPVTLEAEAVAARIEELLHVGYQVADNGAMRRAVPDDFAILLRSHRGRADAYVSALTRVGVPAWAETSGGFLETREVSMVVALLRALDNPLLDIELVAAMLSPLFDFSDDDIARIRAARRGAPFFSALNTAAAQGDEKTGRFLVLFSALRTDAAVMPADRLLLRLYDITDAVAVVQSMRLGEVRVANLQLLVEYAANYHKLGYKRLGGFVGFLNRLEERGGGLSPAGAGGSAGAVRVMSIHRSKGLEFPVVFLCDTFHQFNKMDLRSSTLLHSEYGFACVRRDEETMRQFATVPMQAIRLESERSMLSEELRILYVALTRAREKLVVSGLCKSGLSKRLMGLAADRVQGALSPYAVGEAACYADWILMALLHHKSGEPLRQLSGVEPDSLLDNGCRWNMKIMDAHAAETGNLEQAPPLRSAQPDKALQELIRNRLSFVYTWKNHTVIPNKLAVSTVAKQKQDLVYRFSKRPKFMTATSLTGAEKGDALHKFMQFADYEKSRNDLAQEVRRMQSAGFLTAAETDSLQQAALRAFFEGPLAKRIFASDKVLRELKFTADCGQDILGDYIEGMDDTAKIVLQGVADCVFFESGGAVIVDYKSDFVKNTQELAGRYTDQLRLYRLILSRSLGTPVKQCLVYSFHLGRAVDVF